MINISPRLLAIANMVTKESKIIDIGCDHGLLDIYLYQNNISKTIIASDINSLALNNIQDNIKKYKLDNIIETRLGNGFEVLKETDDIDTAIIAGMGANTIINIVKNKKTSNIKSIIIQSNTKLELLRREITKLNYYIEDEKIVEDNKKMYTIIKFTKGNKKYNKKELYFGPILLQKKEELFQKYNKDRLVKLTTFLKQIPSNRILTKYRIKKEIRLYQNIV